MALSGGFHYYENQLTTPKGSIENIFFNTPCDNYTSPDDGADRLTTLLGFVSRLYQAITPVYVYGIHNWRVEEWQEGRSEYKIPDPVSDEALANNRIDHPTWLMLFPPEMVEEYGREWLLDLPAEHIEELDDGALMVVATRAVPECETDMEVVKLIDDAVTPLEEAFQATNPERPWSSDGR